MHIDHKCGLNPLTSSVLLMGHLRQKLVALAVSDHRSLFVQNSILKVEKKRKKKSALIGSGPVHAIKLEKSILLKRVDK